jgi:microcystin-dependent protein
MPGSPARSPVFQLPRFSNDDVTDFAGQVNSIVDRLETALNALVPVGLPLAWPGAALPTFPLPAGVSAVPGVTPEFAWADGALIDRTIYAAFFTVIGHGYNGGIDPGNNKVRLPDKRGRVSVGADNMGSALGAAGRLPNSNRVRGQNGGEERHTLTTAEIPKTGFVDENNIALNLAHLSGGNALPGGGRNLLDTTGYNGGFLQTAGGQGPHNTMQPYEVDHMIVRIA